MGSITSHMTFGRRSTNYFFLSFFLFSTFLLFPPHCESESLRPISFENWIRDGGFWCVFPFTHINGKWRECRKRQVMRRRAHWRMCHFFWQKFFSILFGNNDTYITAYGNYLVSEVTKMRFWFYSSLLYVQCVILIKSKKCFILIFFCLLGFIFLLMLYAWTMLVLRFHSPALLFLPKLHCITLITKKTHFLYLFFWHLNTVSLYSLLGACWFLYFRMDVTQ